MIVKVCGIKYRENLLDLCEVDIDMIGFNFYEPSVRYVEEIPDIRCSVHLVPSDIKKVGVFVNADIKDIEKTIEDYRLDLVQLHGTESPAMVTQLAKEVDVIKVFHIDANFDFEKLQLYKDCTYFLFDTNSPSFGGSGVKYDWNILSNYKLEIPFLLSGGIGHHDASIINSLLHPSLAGVDINSLFENSPALKDVKKVSHFVQEIKGSYA